MQHIHVFALCLYHIIKYEVLPAAVKQKKQKNTNEWPSVLSQYIILCISFLLISQSLLTWIPSTFQVHSFSSWISPQTKTDGSCLRLIKNRSVLNNYLLRWTWCWFICFIDKVFIDISGSFLALSLLFTQVYRGFYTEADNIRKHIYFVDFLCSCIVLLPFFLIIYPSCFSWSSNPLVPAPFSPSSFQFFLGADIQGSDPAGRHLPCFITLPSLPSPLQLAIMKNWRCGKRGGGKVKEEVKEWKGKGQKPQNKSIVKEIVRLEMEQQRLRVSERVKGRYSVQKLKRGKSEEDMSHKI